VIILFMNDANRDLRPLFEPRSVAIVGANA
jgi:hypothetical protein